MTSGKHAVADGGGLAAEFGEADGGVLVGDRLGVALHGAADREEEVVSGEGHLAADHDELVVIGGKMSLAGDYLLLPIRSAVKRHAQTIANQDTAIRFTKLRSEAAPIGDCMLSRSHLLGII